MKKTAIITGAGPAGLTAAYELLEKTDIKPIIFEMTADIGGISKTVNYKDNRIDIGGHRFFSKSDRVMEWWKNILPVQGAPAKDDLALERIIKCSDQPDAPDPEQEDNVFLIRNRISRILFLRKFFDYPISLSFDTLANLGLFRTFKIGCSYLTSRLLPIRNETSLQDFFINRFGKELYNTFFKDYTEKVWGVSCRKIPPEWGAQRVKGLSITKVLLHAVRSLFSSDKSIGQKKTETSLIDRFLYPKFGPGQLWEKVADMIREKGGELHFNHQTTGFKLDGNNIAEIQVKDLNNGELKSLKADYYLSTMPVRDLIKAISEQNDKSVPANVAETAAGLVYRDFMTVGLLLKKMKIKNECKIKTVNGIVPDNWIYIQERDVKLGRLQIFNNWSPYMVADFNNIWVGMEYFCDEGDELWSMEESDFKDFAVKELEQIGFIDPEDVLDRVLIKMPKAYPAYFGSYERFGEIKEFINTVDNLFLIGRNGMHRYNNQDHSMLTAMQAVENIKNGNWDKNSIWSINTEEEYHESKEEK